VSPARDLVLVSAGLSLDGGGSALLGRLCAAAAAGYCRERGLGFRVLHLGEDHPGRLDAAGGSGGSAIRSFGGDQKALAFAVLAEQMRRPRPALVFDHLGPARTQALLPRALRSPYLLFLLGIEVWGDLTWDRRRALEGAAVRIAISEHTRRRARERHPWLPAVDVLPLALEERALAGTVDSGLLERLGTGFLLIVGRMSASERYKGHDEVLEAMPGVLARCPEARLVVAGGGDDRERLEGRAAALGLSGRAIFTGYVSEATLAELYRRSAAFVMPSRNEGFGLVYLEAMKAGRPCVAARGSAAEEIVADGETGLLVEPGPEPLAAALTALLGDPARASRLGEAGRRRWQERLSFERFRETLATLHLPRLLGERTAAPETRPCAA
jgi:phosphatidylinositol alpha-1,6-mannosyltransferase